MKSENEFFRIIKEESCTILEIYDERTVRPISGAKILKTSEICITVKVEKGAVLRIGDYFYIWDDDKKTLEVQC